MTEPSAPRPHLPFQATAAARDVLRHLNRLPAGQWTYAKGISDEIGLPRVTVGTILSRLAVHHWCESYEETAEAAAARAQKMAGRRGRHTAARRYYRLTRVGRDALAAAEVQDWLRR